VLSPPALLFLCIFHPPAIASLPRIFVLFLLTVLNGRDFDSCLTCWKSLQQDLLQHCAKFSNTFSQKFKEAIAEIDSSFPAFEVVKLQSNKKIKETSKELCVSMIAAKIAVTILAEQSSFSSTNLRAAALCLNKTLTDEDVKFDDFSSTKIQGIYAFVDSVLSPSFQHGVQVFGKCKPHGKMFEKRKDEPFYFIWFLSL